MKKNTLMLIFVLAFGIVGAIKAQLPNVTQTNYSTKDGVVTDARDGKTYAYKKYGSYNWFMQNLNWDGYDGVNENSRGSVGYWGSADPDGTKYGRFYKTGTVNNACPEGWSPAGHGSFTELINFINSDYGASVRLEQSEGWSILDAMQNLRGGGLKSQGGIWDETTTEAGIADPDPMADQIQFNLLPAGGFDGTDYIAGQEVGKKAYIMLDGNDRFHNNTTESNHKRTTLRHARAANTYAMVRCLKIASEGTAITTPYPTTLEIDQIKSSDMERVRLGHTMRKYDHVLTGFYVKKGKSLEVNLEELQAATDGGKIQVVVGTPALLSPEDNSQHQLVKTIDLVPGINKISADKHSGGMVYFRYVTFNQENPQGKVKVSFTNNSEQVRAAHYKYGVTTDSEFLTMLEEYVVPEVMYSSDRLVAVTSRAASIAISVNVKKDIWLEELEKLLEIEDEISGLSDDDPNPTHRRLKPGEVRHLCVQTNPESSPNAGDQRTAYPNPANLLSHLLRPTRPNGVESWMLGHELGHQHQQVAYLIPQAGESTVNIYSIKVRTYFDNGGELYIRTPQAKIDNNISKYLALPDDRRIYEMDSEELESVTEIEKNETRMLPWEQFFYIFGDQFYKTLHRVTREEKQMDESDDEKKSYLITRVSLVSGYDMRDFFDAWGIKVDEPYYQSVIDKTIADANLEKPERWKELTGVGGEKFKKGDYAGWLPLKLKGITSSAPEPADDQPADRLASKNKYCDYASQTGIITDTRDQKKYPFKKVGSYDWFMTNLDWDGYDGKDVSTKGTSGRYSNDDPDGKVYGRYYGTYSGHEEANIIDDPSKWCPDGWRIAIEGDFDRLISDVQKQLDLPSSSDAIKCLKCGGDRDVVTDGLWKKGAGDVNTIMAAQLGVNILPAGVVREETGGYDSGDEDGVKAAFVTGGWYHNIFNASSNSKGHVNRFFEHYGSVRCIRLSANLKTQEITFHKLENVQLSQEAFAPEITVTSGLPVTVTSSNSDVATIVDGKINIVGIGTSTIEATQEGNDEYHPADAKSQLLTVVATEVNENEVLLTINGKEGFLISETYSVPCEGDIKKLDIIVNTLEGIEVLPAREFSIDLEVGTKAVPFKLKSGDVTVDMQLNVEKKFEFDDIVHTKWNHTYIVRNNPANNGSYSFSKYTWYKNNVKVHDGQYYNAKDSEQALYSVEMTTDDDKRFKTCPVSLTPNTAKLTLSSNNVKSGEIIQLDATQMPDEFFNNSKLQILSLSGNTISSMPIKEKITSLNMSVNAGMYIIYITSDVMQENFKVVVK